MSDALDKQIDELFSKVSLQKKELETLKDDINKKWITTCTFNNINIQTASHDSITEIIRQLILREFVDRQMKAAGFEVKEDKIYGFTLADWYSDLGKRMKVIEYREKENKLKAIEDKLNTLVSPEKRREMEIAEIAKTL